MKTYQISRTKHQINKQGLTSFTSHDQTPIYIYSNEDEKQKDSDKRRRPKQRAEL